MAEWVRKALAGQDAARAYVSEHLNGPGGVGAGEEDIQPVVIGTTEVRGEPVSVMGNDGSVLRVSTSARILELEGGRSVVVGGKTGDPIDARDLEQVLSAERLRELKEVSMRRAKKNGTPSHVVGR